MFNRRDFVRVTALSGFAAAILGQTPTENETQKVILGADDFPTFVQIGNAIVSFSPNGKNDKNVKLNMPLDSDQSLQAQATLDDTKGMLGLKFVSVQLQDSKGTTPISSSSPLLQQVRSLITRAEALIPRNPVDHTPSAAAFVNDPDNSNRVIFGANGYQINYTFLPDSKTYRVETIDVTGSKTPDASGVKGLLKGAEKAIPKKGSSKTPVPARDHGNGTLAFTSTAAGLSGRMAIIGPSVGANGTDERTFTGDSTGKIAEDPNASPAMRSLLTAVGATAPQVRTMLPAAAPQ